MLKYHCLNPISQVGLSLLGEGFERTEHLGEADAVLVRSANMHDLELPPCLEAVARAGAGVNNIPLDKCAEKGIVVFNTPGANANGVKELVLAGLFLASRDIVGGINWVQSQSGNEDVAKAAEKEKKHFAGCEIKGKKLGIIGLGAIGVLVANAAVNLEMEVYGRSIWAWKCLATIPIFPWMRHGICQRRYTTLRRWRISTKNVTILPSMCRFWTAPER